MRSTVTLVVLGLVIGALTGCGSSDDQQTSSPGRSNSSSGDTSAYCAAGKNFSPTVTATNTSTEQTLAAVRAIEAAAPAEAKAGWTAYAEGYEKFVEGSKLMKNPSRLEEAAKLMEESSTTLESPAVRAATDHLAKTCG